MSNLLKLDDSEIQVHLDNGDVRCDVCGSFLVTTKSITLFQRGRPHRQEYSETMTVYECECGREWEA